MVRMLVLAVLAVVATTARAGGVETTVGIDGFAYTPANFTIEAGQTINFVASGFHPLQFDDHPLGCGSDCNVNFRVPGSYGFHCVNHGGPGTGMAGTITVVASTITDRVFHDPFEQFLAARDN